MIIKENITLFICEFCKKKLFVKQAMKRHEVKCSKNPDNFSACTDCSNLEEKPIEYTRFGFNGYSETEEIIKTHTFHCKKLNKDIYPAAVLHKGLPEKYPETFFEQEVMPTECEHFEYSFE